MPAKYQKFGLRRDKDLKDLSNPNLALANILDDLSNEAFVPGDLNVINGLRNTDLTTEDLQSPNGAVQEFTTRDQEDNVIVKPFSPLVTIQDRIKNFKIFLGDPPFSGGGNGLLATFVPYDAMFPTSSGNFVFLNEADKKSFRGDQLFNPNYTPPNKAEPPISDPQDFWDNGVFLFGSLLFSEFTDTYGLVQWEGFAQSGVRLDLTTNGLLKIEYDLFDDDNWEFLKNIYDEERTVSFASATYDANADATTLTLTTSSDHLVTGIDDKLKFPGTSIDGDGTDFLRVTEVNRSGSVIVQGDATSNSSITFPREGKFFFDLGKDEIVTGDDVRIPTTFDGNYIKLRISYYFPDFEDGRIFPEKRLYDDNDNTDKIPYTLFFQEQPNRVLNVESYEFFEDNRLSKRKKLTANTNIGAEDTTALQSGKLIFAKYAPPVDFSISGTDGRYYGNSAATYSGASKFTFSGNPFNPKVGDFLVITSGTTAYSAIIDDLASDIDGNKEIFIKQEVANAIGVVVGQLYTVHVFDSIGLISLTTGTASNATSASISNMASGSETYSSATAVNDIRDDYLTAGVKYTGSPNTVFTHFKRVEKTGTNTIQLNSVYSGDSFNMTTGNEYIFATYASKGLQDLSTESQCGGTFGREVASPANQGQAVVALTSVAGISGGEFVQFGNTSGGTNYDSDYIPSGVTVASVNTSNSTITLSSNIQSTIPQNATLVFIESNPGNNAKEFCVLPLNTAPPFEGTDEGLRTPAGTFPNLNVQGLIFGELNLYDVKVENLTPLNLSESPTYSQVIGIDHNSIEYNFLIE